MRCLKAPDDAAFRGARRHRERALHRRRSSWLAVRLLLPNLWRPGDRAPRHGPVNTRHFAHVSGQERPECYVGAVNLSRRHLAIEYLAAAASDLALPTCDLTVRGPAAFIHISAPASWFPGVLARMQWDPAAPKTEPVVRPGGKQPMELPSRSSWKSGKGRAGRQPWGSPKPLWRPSP